MFVNYFFSYVGRLYCPPIISVCLPFVYISQVFFFWSVDQPPLHGTDYYRRFDMVLLIFRVVAWRIKSKKKKNWVKAVKMMVKVILTANFDYRSIVRYECLPPGQTSNTLFTVYIWEMMYVANIDKCRSIFCLYS